MKNYLLNDYKLSPLELLQSVFVSEYGLRHLAQAKLHPQQKWGHRIIAMIELCPLIGIIASLIEALFADRVWLFKGTQISAQGNVSIEKAEVIRAKLASQSSPLGIHFNKSKIVDQLVGGTCSAMALQFVDRYFQIKKSCEGSEQILKQIAAIGIQFSASSAEMRDRQAAYNTIEVVKSSEERDFSKNKMQSLANDHNLSIKFSSNEMDVEKLDTEQSLQNDVDALPEGAYLVRIIKPANNEKLEEHGHSLIYIREQGVNLFYDPNLGARNLVGAKHSTVLFNSFKENFATFQVSKARFYQLQTT